ncbi:pre-rRNA-processing protein TSR2 homolog [Striga asiatica]|uniref:Pre-rRNA-processing protein TSR2 homolog n=1 Tax=Striga asiatica TaxID=4170 RepID=A0A5A7QWV3_STRAF|nr:pre-rRNA-processing protein TSR2 homolog [Striga asiatica]
MEYSCNISGFQERISGVLSKWTALQMAVHNEWGGHDSITKYNQLASDILVWLLHCKAQLQTEDLETLLHERLLLTFNTEIEDGSIEEVAEQLIIIRDDYLQGNVGTPKYLRENQASRRKNKQKQPARLLKEKQQHANTRSSRIKLSSSNCRQTATQTMDQHLETTRQKECNPAQDKNPKTLTSWTLRRTKLLSWTLTPLAQSHPRPNTQFTLPALTKINKPSTGAAESNRGKKATTHLGQLTGEGQSQPKSHASTAAEPSTNKFSSPPELPHTAPSPKKLRTTKAIVAVVVSASLQPNAAPNGTTESRTSSSMIGT